MLIGGCIGDEPHEPGDVLDAPPTQAKRWIKAGIAEEDNGGGGKKATAQPSTPEEEEED